MAPQNFSSGDGTLNFITFFISSITAIENQACMNLTLPSEYFYNAYSQKLSTQQNYNVKVHIMHKPS